MPVLHHRAYVTIKTNSQHAGAYTDPETARPPTTLGGVEPIVHMLCGTDFRLSLSARIEHMFVYGRDRRSCSFPDCDRTYYV